MAVAAARRAWNRLDSMGLGRLTQVQATAAAGDAIVAVALAGSVFFSEDPNTARSRVAMSLLLTVAPFAVVAPFLGPLIDRSRTGRRAMLCVASAGRALLCLLMANSLDQVFLYPLAFGSLVLSKAHAVARNAAVPEVVPATDQLVRANSFLAIGAVLAGFVGGAVGVATGWAVGGQWSLRMGAVVFVVAAVLSLEVGGRSRAAADEIEGDAVAGEDRLAGSGLRSRVRAAAGAMAALRGAAGFLAFLVAFDLRRDGAPTWWFGVAVTASMLGTSVGNLIAPLLRRRLGERHILFTASAFVALAAASAAASGGRWASMGLVAAVGIAASAAKLAFDAVVQHEVPTLSQARWFARFEAVFQLAWVLGALVPVLLHIGPVAGAVTLAVFAAVNCTWSVGASHRA